ncbi:MAG TPA: DUF3372 domain-containing protein, partial [Anaerolineae bacterium]|nr:DUF3372 domain-containing protein [Anaerolineae bacterium]
AFNDRRRDAARGCSAFGGLREQGFVTGLYDAPNATENRSSLEQQARLLTLTDWLRVSLAGSLREYRLRDLTGTWLTGADVGYNGLPAGYTRAPQEAVNYVSAHDNETLFDAVQLKAPDEATVADRVRMHNLGIDLVMLAQGVPFFHAGDDLLRSKSLDRNSYNSGDWFNRLDFSIQDNGWGAGLPPAWDNQPQWPVMRELLGNPALKPSPDDIQAAAAHFQEMLRLRQSSKLFRLETAQDVQERLTFFNTGPEQTPGLIVMALSDAVGADLDPDYELLVVLFNATQTPQTFAIDAFQGTDFALHPILAASADPVVRAARYDKTTGAFTVPGRTTAVFAAAKAPEISILPPPNTTTPPTTAPTVPAPTVAPSTATPRPTPTATAPSIVPHLESLLWPVAIAAGVIVLLVVILWSRTRE